MYAIYIIIDFIDMFINHKKKKAMTTNVQFSNKEHQSSDFMFDLLKVAV